MAALRRLVLAAFVVGLSALPSLPSLDFLPRTDWTDPDRAWARGPVWYVMTHAEYSGYRRLRTQDDRAGFIREFWSLRDPIPDTPENELEAEFWERVRIADDRFGQDIKPGWKTERGKVFIMLGPPDNAEGDQILADRWGASSWIYDLGRMPYQLRMAVEESLRVASERAVIRIKVREETEGMRSLGGAMPVQSSVLRPTEFLPLAETLIRRVPGPDSLRNLGHVMRVPEVLDRLYSRVHVSTVFTMIPVEARVDFRPIED
ncbi:MAG TPA: GWxTD domain-containing protein, partial [Candidatus Polarisedimenticolia bacterium]|nr:GWxTD domain-containing protein [Candidatus Polarisedimenticolia bacterium]